MDFNKENLPKIKQIIMNKDIYIFFVPSTKLKEMVIAGQHPLLKGMPDNRKADILSGNGIMTRKHMVWKFIEGTLDEKNTFILSNGEIRVIDKSLKFQDKLIGNSHDKK